MFEGVDDLLDFPVAKAQTPMYDSQQHPTQPQQASQQSSMFGSQFSRRPSTPQPQPTCFKVPSGYAFMYQPSPLTPQMTPTMYQPQQEMVVSYAMPTQQQPIMSYQAPVQQFHQPKEERRQTSPKEDKNRKPQFLTRGARRYILNAFTKDQLMAMRIGNRSVFGSTKEQLVKSAVEITSTRDDVINLILSSFDITSED